MIFIENEYTLALEEKGEFSDLCRYFEKKFDDFGTEEYLRSLAVYSWYFYVEGPFLLPNGEDKWVTYMSCGEALWKCWSYITKSKKVNGETLMLLAFIFLTHGDLFDFNEEMALWLLKQGQLSSDTDIVEACYLLRFEQQGYCVSDETKNRFKQKWFNGSSLICDYFKERIDNLCTEKDFSYKTKYSKQARSKQVIFRRPILKSLRKIYRRKDECHVSYDKALSAYMIDCFRKFKIQYFIGPQIIIKINQEDISETSIIPKPARQLCSRILGSNEPLFWKIQKTSLIIKDTLTMKAL